MQDPAKYDPETRNDIASQQSRAELREHYFHFGDCYGKQSTASLVVAGSRLDVVVPDQTQYGFTVIGSAKTAEGLRLGTRWVLTISEKRYEVFPQWIHCAADGRVQIGLRSMRQLPTEPKPIACSRFRRFLRPFAYRGGQALLALTVLLSALWVKKMIDASHRSYQSFCDPVELVWKSDECSHDSCVVPTCREKAVVVTD